jgi:hypothetical protein
VKPALWFLLGAGVMYVAAVAMIQPANCCARVSAAVRGEVVGKFGELGGLAFDAAGLSKFSPGLLNLFGV